MYRGSKSSVAIIFSNVVDSPELAQTLIHPKLDMTIQIKENGSTRTLTPHFHLVCFSQLNVVNMTQSSLYSYGAIITADLNRMKAG